MQCEAIADVLPGVVDGSAALDRSQRRHVEQCLRCQAELAQYRKLLRGLHALRFQTGLVPGDLTETVMAYLEGEQDRPAMWSILSGRRAAYLGGIAATAAGAGAAFVLARRGRLPLAG
ncbi:MAG: hypothetical protein KDB09_15585 [Acidimicrobiales bacterium]|nr:hypothetical protein [Acidimicrobiales bacterium]